MNAQRPNRLLIRATADGVIAQAGRAQITATLGPDGAPRWSRSSSNAGSMTLRLGLMTIAWAWLPDLMPRAAARIVDRLAVANGLIDASFGAVELGLPGGQVTWQWLTGMLLWAAPAVFGVLMARTARGRRLLSWHGAEHVAFSDGSLLAARCGSALHSRAASLHLAMMLAVAICTESALAAQAPFLCFAARLPCAMLALWWAASHPPRRLDSLTRWLQRHLVARPDRAQVHACTELARRIRS